jgi:hypothetical protein
MSHEPGSLIESTYLPSLFHLCYTYIKYKSHNGEREYSALAGYPITMHDETNRPQLVTNAKNFLQSDEGKKLGM